ncbi:solute carrier family 35 member F1-like [Senna tora]|uniref:Solute carrier family 35 member F1-like n=1 Tax=Senna tora TaxID=362788 RepID=A0A834SNY2_9FABA|nr:solute carrier family 35 member F1-like [Senna tora]
MDWRGLISWWRRHLNLRVFGLLLLGQLVSALMALMSLTSSLIADLGVYAPLTQSLFNYALLTMVYGSILIYRRHNVLVSWYWYLLLGFIDVEGKYLVNKAFQYSSITSVRLLECWVIPWAMILTWIFLGTRYSLWQFGGMALCMMGLGLLLLSRVGVGGPGGSKPLLGDLLVIAGTVSCALCNVGEEYCVKKKDRVELVSMIGVYGCLLTIIELYSSLLVHVYYISIIELKTLEFENWSTDILGGATMFNLSLLTSEMWEVVFRVYVYHQKVDLLYLVSFAVAVIGLIIYCATEKECAAAPSIEGGNLDTEYQLLNNDESTESRSGSSVSSFMRER